MGNVDQELLGDDTAGQRGIDIPDNHDKVRLFFNADLLKSHHDLCRLDGMGAGTGIEKVLRFRNLQVFKKSLRHLIVIMLTRMDDPAIDARNR